MKKIEFIVRKASDISQCNEIANFKNLYFNPIPKISAISFENIKGGKTIDRIYILLKILENYFPNNNRIKFILPKSGVNNSVVNYIGGWGLLERDGIDIDKIDDRKEFVKKTTQKIEYLLEGSVDINNQKLLIKLLEYRNIYFVVNYDGVEYQPVENDLSYEKWIYCYLIAGREILFFLRDPVFDEDETSELVLIKKNIDVLSVV